MDPKAVCVLGLSFVMGFKIFVRSVLILKQSLFQSVLEIKVFSMQREKQPIKVSRQSVVCHLAGKRVLKLFFESVV